MNLAPITIFVYNRIFHLKQTIEALIKNEYASESHLIIFSDGFKGELDRPKVNEVREYIRTINGFKFIKIIYRERNYGLAESIIAGVTQIVNEYGSIIVLEDDLITSPFFLKFMNDGLNIYAECEQVISIHGYIYPVKAKLPQTFFIKGADCLGWATWKRGWDLFENDAKKLLNKIRENKLKREFDFNNTFHYTDMLERQANGENKSWAILWYASSFLSNRLTLYPGRSVVFHTGGDGSGTNSGYSSFLNVKLSDIPILLFPIEIKEDKESKKKISNYFKSIKTPIFKKFLNRIHKFF